VFAQTAAQKLLACRAVIVAQQGSLRGLGQLRSLQVSRDYMGNASAPPKIRMLPADL
jgi:hypothetical protein